MVKAAPLLLASVLALAALPVAIAVAGCSQAATTTTDPVMAPQATSGLVIAQIVTHDAKVAIVSGGPARELRVVVRKMDGTLVADGVTLDELRTRDPDLYMVVTSAFASNGSYVDATLDLGHLN